jgi:hypothetical protein
MKKNLTILTIFIAACFVANAQTPQVITIDSARSYNPSTGLPYLNDTFVQLSGIVAGPNQYPTANGDVFILYSGGWGVKVYSKHTYNYPVANGDSVVVVGELNNYDGEAEIDLFDSVAVDTIYKVGVGDTLIPSVVTSIGEVNESELIEIQNIDMTTATNWLNGQAGYHDFAAVASGFTIYIDSFMNNAMYNAQQPQGIYNIIGFGEQYCKNAPYLTGYEIGPRSMKDFILITTGINDVNVALEARVFPNPSNGNFFVYLNDNSVTEANVSVIDISGRKVYMERQGIENGRFTVNAQNLTPGIYMVEVENAGEVFRNKIVVSK